MLMTRCRRCQWSAALTGTMAYHIPIMVMLSKDLSVADDAHEIGQIVLELSTGKGCCVSWGPGGMLPDDMVSGSARRTCQETGTLPIAERWEPRG